MDVRAVVLVLVDKVFVGSELIDAVDVFVGAGFVLQTHHSVEVGFPFLLAKSAPKERFLR